MNDAQPKISHSVWHNATVVRVRRMQMEWAQGFNRLAHWPIRRREIDNSSCRRRGQYQQGFRTYVLDGDNVRHGLRGDLSFSIDDRHENIRRTG